MKSIHVLIPKDKDKVVLNLLEKLEFPYFLIDSTNYLLFIINTPDEKVEDLVDSLKKIGVGQLYGTYIIYEASYPTIVEQEEPTEEMHTKRISREEILMKISENAALTRNYILFTITASIIATLGLLTNNVVMIVASMIISPLMGPILGTSIGTVLNLSDLRKESLKSEFWGLFLAVLVSFIITLMLPYTGVTEEMLIRSYPSLFDILFALSAGVAAALSTVSAEAMILVGVAIAASLLPPATNIGIGLAYMVKGVPASTHLIVGSSLLLSVNILAITIASLLFFWIVGIRPGESIRKVMIAQRKMRKTFIILVLLFALISIPLIQTSIESYKSEKISLILSKKTIEFMDKYAPEAKIISIDVKYLSDTDTAEVYLAIGVENVTQKIIELPKNLAEYLKEQTGLSISVYVQIYLAYKVG